ncbi:MAG: response regulator [Chloroflexota bacterium]
MMRNIRVLIIAPHDISRNGLIALMNRPASKIRVVGAFPELAEGTSELAHLDADVLLLDDILPPATDVIDVVQHLRKEFSHLSIIVLSSKLHIRYLEMLLAAGVSGYIYREDRLEASLVLGIETVYQGHLYLSPHASGLLIKRSNPDKTLKLNPCDRKVLRLIDQGLTPKDIAVALKLTLRSVYRIQNKLRAAVGAPP